MRTERWLPCPKLSLDSLLSGEFATDYETYLTDQFIFRDGWIGMKTTAERLTFPAGGQMTFILPRTII